jgi:hypothetical protein
LLYLCRETRPNKIYESLAKVQDIAVWPLGKLSAADQQRRFGDLAKVYTLIKTLPEDTDEHRRRRLEYKRERGKL